MSSLTFDDFEEYADKIGHAQLEFTLPRVERPFWSIQHREIAGVHLQCGSEANGLIVEGAASADGCLLFVQKSGSRCHANGERMPTDAIFISPPGGEFRLASNDAHDWYSLLIPTDFLPRELFRASAGGISAAQLLEPGGAHVAELTRLVETVQQIGQKAPEVLAESRSAASLRAEILALTQGILEAGRPGLITGAGASELSSAAGKRAGRPAVAREQVLRAVLRRFETTPDDPPSVAQLAEFADVSERTLRTVFQEFYGMSPRRFLHLRRLHQAREALLDRSGERTIAQVAASLGFWDLGRFAGDYRRLFLETPSATKTPRKPRVAVPDSIHAAPPKVTPLLEPSVPPSSVPTPRPAALPAGTFRIEDEAA